MAKKSRRTRRQQRPRPTQTTAPAQTAHEPERGSSTPAGSSNQRKQVDFQAEYPYVVQDLRSMAIIAVGMLGVLIALSFIIH
jgi:hypothetical protein